MHENGLRIPDIGSVVLQHRDLSQRIYLEECIGLVFTTRKEVHGLLFMRKLKKIQQQPYLVAISGQDIVEQLHLMPPR